jgi:hypothetical protein
MSRVAFALAVVALLAVPPAHAVIGVDCPPGEDVNCPQQVPLPAPAVLIGIGLAGLLVALRRR